MIYSFVLFVYLHKITFYPIKLGHDNSTLFDFKIYTMFYEFLKTLAIIFSVFGIAIVLMNVRYIFKKEEFRGSCASNNPLLKNQFGECTVCGKVPESDCDLPVVKKA